MASSSQNTSEETCGNTVEFNYAKVKQIFYSELDRICPKTVSLTNPSWATVIEFIKKTITEAKVKLKNNEKIDYISESAMNMYDVITIAEKNVLILKQEVQGEPIVVISNEECFDLLATIHLQNNHANFDTIKSLISTKYMISEQNIKLFLRLCNVCKKGFVKHSYHAFIIDFEDFPDEPYKYLLTLIERTTNFCILRPLVIKSQTEITLELLKVFSDFGLPSSLLVPQIQKDLFVGAHLKILLLCSEFVFEVETVFWSVLVVFDKTVKQKLCDWMSMSCCTNWATGCRMVQWQMNNMESDNTTPYKSLFGVCPNDTLYSNPVWLKFTDASQSQTQTKISIQEFIVKYNLSDKDQTECHEIRKSGITTPNTLILDVTHKLCIFCHNIVYRPSFCFDCKCPMHSFCGMRFVYKRKKVETLCFNCKFKKD